MQPLWPFLRFSLYCHHRKKHPSVLVRESILGLLHLQFPIGLISGCQEVQFPWYMGLSVSWPSYRIQFWRFLISILVLNCILSVFVVLHFLTGPQLVVKKTRLRIVRMCLFQRRPQIPWVIFFCSRYRKLFPLYKHSTFWNICIYSICRRYLYDCPVL